MRTIKFERDGIEEEITVLSATGYHDGYYWDMSATVVYNDIEYSIQDAGSGSGYVPHYSSISINGPKKLLQSCENKEINENDWWHSWDYIEDTICKLLDDFLTRGCKESLEYIEAGSCWNLEVHIDGKRVEK